MSVNVTNKRGWPLSGLSKEAFTLVDEKTPLEITSFSNEDAPYSMGVVLDMSRSVTGKNLSHAVILFDDFLNASNKANEYFVMAFAARPVIVIDWTKEMRGILSRLVTGDSRAQTSLYDSLYLAIEKAKTGNYKQRAIILISDGMDTTSKYTFSEVRESLRESDVMFHSMVINQGSDSGSPLGIEGKRIMDELCSTTGGRCFYPSNRREIKEAFDVLAAEMRSQYRIGFKPSAASDKTKWRSVKVKVVSPQNAPPEFRDLKVRSREGYYPHKLPR